MLQYMHTHNVVLDLSSSDSEVQTHTQKGLYIRLSSNDCVVIKIIKIGVLLVGVRNEEFSILFVREWKKKQKFDCNKGDISLGMDALRCKELDTFSILFYALKLWSSAHYICNYWYMWLNDRFKRVNEFYLSVLCTFYIKWSILYRCLLVCNTIIWSKHTLSERVNPTGTMVPGTFSKSVQCVCVHTMNFIYRILIPTDS